MRAVQHLWSSDRDDGQLVGHALRLAIARDLARIYADVLHDPVPPDLRRLIEGPEHQTTHRRSDRPAAPGQRSSI
jgi:hypothetical protein